MPRYSSDSSGFSDSDSPTSDPRSGDPRHNNNRNQAPNRSGRMQPNEATTRHRQSNRTNDRSNSLFDYTDDFARNFCSRNEYNRHRAGASENFDNENDSESDSDYERSNGGRDAFDLSIADRNARRNALGGPSDRRNPRTQQEGIGGSRGDWDRREGRRDGGRDDGTVGRWDRRERQCDDDVRDGGREREAQRHASSRDRLVERNDRRREGG